MRQTITTSSWQATFGGRAAIEVTVQGLPASAVAECLLAIDEGAVEQAAFVVVRLASRNRRELASAMKSVGEARVGRRVCLALDQGQLAELDLESLKTEHVGLMLDVDDDTVCCSAIASEAIEAVRFGTGYALAAVQTLRGACVLDAMLGLARNIGLTTFGPEMAGRSGLLCPEPTFDYVCDEEQTDTRVRPAARMPSTMQRDFALSR